MQKRRADGSLSAQAAGVGDHAAGFRSCCCVPVAHNLPLPDYSRAPPRPSRGDSGSRLDADRGVEPDLLVGPVPRPAAAATQLLHVTGSEHPVEEGQQRHGEHRRLFKVCICSGGSRRLGHSASIRPRLGAWRWPRSSSSPSSGGTGTSSRWSCASRRQSSGETEVEQSPVRAVPVGLQACRWTYGCGGRLASGRNRSSSRSHACSAATVGVAASRADLRWRRR